MIPRGGCNGRMKMTEDEALREQHKASRRPDELRRGEELPYSFGTLHMDRLLTMARKPGKPGTQLWV